MLFPMEMTRKEQQAVKEDSQVTHFIPLWLCGVSEDSGFCLADKVAVRVHLQGAVEIFGETKTFNSFSKK